MAVRTGYLKDEFKNTVLPNTRANLVETSKGITVEDALAGLHTSIENTKTETDISISELETRTDDNIRRLEIKIDEITSGSGPIISDSVLGGGNADTVFEPEAVLGGSGALF